MCVFKCFHPSGEGRQQTHKKRSKKERSALVRVDALLTEAAACEDALRWE